MVTVIFIFIVCLIENGVAECVHDRFVLIARRL